MCQVQLTRLDEPDTICAAEALNNNARYTFVGLVGRFATKDTLVLKDSTGGSASQKTSLKSPNQTKA